MARSTEDAVSSVLYLQKLRQNQRSWRAMLEMHSLHNGGVYVRCCFEYFCPLILKHAMRYRDLEKCHPDTECRLLDLCILLLRIVRVYCSTICTYVCGVARWLGRRSLAGGLSLICA